MSVVYTIPTPPQHSQLFRTFPRPKRTVLAFLGVHRRSHAPPDAHRQPQVPPDSPRSPPTPPLVHSFTIQSEGWSIRFSPQERKSAVREGAGRRGLWELGGVSPLPQVVPDGRLVQALALVQEAGDLLGCVLQKFILHQELDPLVGGGRVSALTARKPRLPPPPQGPQPPPPPLPSTDLGQALFSDFTQVLKYHPSHLRAFAPTVPSALAWLVKHQEQGPARSPMSLLNV